MDFVMKYYSPLLVAAGHGFLPGAVYTASKNFFQ